MIKNKMCLWDTNAPGHKKVQIDYFWYQGHGHKAIDPDVIWKCFISLVYMPNMKSLSLTV